MVDHRSGAQVPGSYYDLLGVPIIADEAAIRARYVLLMRRHHPDVNRSPTAHARAAALNAAFETLMDPDRRARHDAELARQRADIVTARSLVLYRDRSRGRRANRPLLKRYATPILLAAVLSATVLTGWQIQRRLLSGSGGFSPPASTDDSHTEARKTVAALNAATVQAAQDMPPVSDAAVAGGVGAFRRLRASGQLAQARPFSVRCHDRAVDLGTWEARDLCVAFDQAVFVRVARGNAGAADAGYFTDRHDRAGHLYVSSVSSMDAIEVRLNRIRDLVTPAPDPGLQARTARVLHRIAKRTWRFADPARFGVASADTMPAAHDF